MTFATHGHQRRRNLIGLFATTTLLVAACSDDATGTATATALAPGSGAAEDDSPKPEAQWLTCTADADCTTMPDGCCGCANGGKALAINKAHEDDFDGLVAFECGATVCATVISTDATCAMHAACVEGKCVLVSGKAPAPPEPTGTPAPVGSPVGATDKGGVEGGGTVGAPEIEKKKDSKRKVPAATSTPLP